MTKSKGKWISGVWIEDDDKLAELQKIEDYINAKPEQLESEKRADWLKGVKRFGPLEPVQIDATVKTRQEWEKHYKVSSELVDKRMALGLSFKEALQRNIDGDYTLEQTIEVKRHRLADYLCDFICRKQDKLDAMLEKLMEEDPAKFMQMVYKPSLPKQTTHVVSEVKVEQNLPTLININWDGKGEWGQTEYIDVDAKKTNLKLPSP